MSLEMALFLVCLVLPMVFVAALCQAYVVAGAVNLFRFGLAKKPGELGRWAILRRYNYLWFVPPLAAALFTVEGQTYRFPSPQAILLFVGGLCGFFGLGRTIKDVLDRRYGPSTVRERGAVIYAAILSGGAVLAIYYAETL